MTGAWTQRIVAAVAFACLCLTAPPSAGQTPAQAPARDAFMAGLTRLAEALAGSYGDERARATTSLREMRQAWFGWRSATIVLEAQQVQAGANRRRRAEAQRALVMAYLEQGRVDDARQALTAALQLDPARADAWVLLGAVHSQLTQPADAAQALREALALDPRQPVALYLLATELQRAGQSVEAAAARLAFASTRREILARPAGAEALAFPQWGLLPHGANVTPFFAPTAYADGFARLRRGDIEEALDAFDEALAHDPLVGDASDADRRLARASLAFRRSELPDAASHAEAIIAANPTHSEARRVRGMIAWAGGQHEESIRHLTAAIELNPADERARVSLADVLVEAGRLDAARAVVLDTLRAIPESGQASYKRGTVSSSLRDYAGALEAFEQAARRTPVVGTERIYRRIGELPTGVDPDPEARLTRRLGLDLNNPQAHVDLGSLYLTENRTDEAVVELLAAVLVDPRDTAAYAALAQAYVRSGDFAGAEAAARRAVTLNDTHAGARYALATALARQGDAEAATREFDRYRQMLADAQTNRRRDFEVNVLMRDVRESLGRDALDDAIAQLRAAVRLKPDDAALSLSLGVFLMNAGRYREATGLLEGADRLGAGPDVHRYLADAYTAMGRLREAKEQRDLFDRERASAPPR